MQTRRGFLAQMPALGAAATLFMRSAHMQAEVLPLPFSGMQRISLEDGWLFRLDPEGRADAATLSSLEGGWQQVRVPHTWQTLGGYPDYAGVAWYRTELLAPESWRESFARIEFEAAFHSAQVYLNGAMLGEHIGKGYLAFCLDLTPGLKLGAPNQLLIRVDNAKKDVMLPRLDSYDWTADGGLIRPVSLLITPPVFIERLEIDAVPDLEMNAAEIQVQAVVRNTLATSQSVQVSGTTYLEQDAARNYPFSPATVALAPNFAAKVTLERLTISKPRLWHFDAPHLYEAEIGISSPAGRHILRENYGIRRFEARGRFFHLNGERITLMGVERMAGSHPELGMAETAEWIEANHRAMKELNCIFTRVHWQQDRRVLDFCDRNGILMQEEVPVWGPDTFTNVSAAQLEQLKQNGLEQLRAMIARDRNHPCIVSWGLCNEVDGQNPNARVFGAALAREARLLDPSRLLTYASNSLETNPEKDMAGEFDFISCNEYYGSWAPGGVKEVREQIARMRRAFPDKPLVISEYGWCECMSSIPPGDAGRIAIIDGHTPVLRESGEVAGAIYFDFNDYRTQMGDKGVGAFKQRVHGVVDLYGNRKPSFEALRAQCSPLASFAVSEGPEEVTLRIETRTTLPAYTLRGYEVRWRAYGYDDLAMEGRLDALPELVPGANFSLAWRPALANPRFIVAEMIHPRGHVVATATKTLAGARD